MSVPYVKRSISQAILAAALAGLLMSAGAAQAAVEKSRSPFQRHLVDPCSGSAPYCEMEMYQVKKKRRLEIKSVSCYAHAASPGAVNYVTARIRTAANEVIDDFLVPAMTADGASNDTFIAAGETMLFANAGDTVLAGVSTNGDATHLYCKISGDLVVLK